MPDDTELWASGLSALNCKPDENQLEQLKKYVGLLDRWNKTYNLTAVRNPQDMIPLHIFDSLAIAEFIKGSNCLDVGSGAGLPTIPLAIIQPERQFIALDTNGKKTRFIQQAIIELNLKNVRVAHARVEKWEAPETFNAIISRAFASVTDFVKLSSAHLAKNGVLYAMKGQYPEDELRYFPKGYQLIASHQLDVPFVEGERHLLELTKNR